MSDSYGKIKVDEIENSDGTLLDLTAAVTTEATTSTKGYLSAADKTKLDGIAAGAQVNATNTVIDANYVATDENFTTADHTKLDGIQAGAQANAVTSVNGSTGAVTVQGFSGDYNDLTNTPTIDPDTVVDANYVATDENFTTADHSKLDGIETGAQVNAANTVIDASYVATDENFTTADHTKLDGIAAGAQVNAANTVVDANYVATDENFTTADHSKLDGIAAGAQVNAVTSVNGATGAVTVQGFSGAYADLTGKPTLGTAAATASTAYATSAQGATADSAIQPGDPNPVMVSSTGNLPSASSNHGAVVHVHGEGAMYFAHAGSWIKLQNESSAFSGSYNNLSDKPTIIENAFSTSAPSSPALGDFWVDTTDSPPELKSYNGSAWVGVGSSTPTTSPPSINGVVLSEDNASGDRFTSQTFSAAITMLDDGAPVSQKGIKGKVTASFTQFPTTTASTAVNITSTPTSQSPGTLATVAQGLQNDMSEYNKECAICRVISPTTGSVDTLLFRWADNGVTEYVFKANDELTAWSLLASGSASYTSDRCTIAYLSEDGLRVNCQSRYDDKPAQFTLANLYAGNYSKDYSFTYYTDKYKYTIMTQGNPAAIYRNLRSTGASAGMYYFGNVSSSSSSRMTGIEMGDTLWIFGNHSASNTLWAMELSDTYSDTKSWPASGYNLLYPQHTISTFNWRSLQGLWVHNGVIYLSSTGQYLKRFPKGVNSSGINVTMPTLSGWDRTHCNGWLDDKGDMVVEVRYYQIGNSNNRTRRYYTTNNQGATWTPIYWNDNYSQVSGQSSHMIADVYSYGNRLRMTDSGTNWKGRVYSLGYQDVTVPDGATLSDLNVGDAVRLSGVSDPFLYSKITAITSNGNSTTTIRLIGGPDAVVGNTIEALNSTGSAVSTRFLVIDATGAISTHQAADPGFVNLGPGTSQSITFPATFPTGNAPDAELLAGTTIQVEVEAVNSVASDTYPSNIITPS